MTDFLDDKRREISDRLKELEPAVDEYSRLEAAASALAKVSAATPAATTTAVATTPRRRGPGRPRGSGKAVSTGTATPKVGRKKVGRPPDKKVGRPPGKKVDHPAAKKVGRPPGKVGRPPGRPKGRGGRRKGSGTRAAQALSYIQAQPGITTPELATKIGIHANYLYHILPGLVQERKVKKQGRGWQLWDPKGP